ncbi:hypothetical protein Tsubulata_017886 [Turnera subulata]|uniref:Uncharacterized protein n=1 Tax=Turnera subulata TaxID=218843 RepID=A0A9Q0G5K6_9ROSI|nr:hypothetical protein Tsubulata_017886 [Turnera subulata]
MSPIKITWNKLIKHVSKDFLQVRLDEFFSGQSWNSNDWFQLPCQWWESMEDLDSVVGFSFRNFLCKVSEELASSP